MNSKQAHKQRNEESVELKVFTMSLVLAAGCGLFAPEKLFADESQSKQAAPVPAAAQPAAAAETVILSADFNTDGQLGEWLDAKRVSDKDVSNGHLLMVNDKKAVDAEGDTDPSTHLYYQVGDQEGNIAVEIKFDEFAPNSDSYFVVNLGSGSGSQFSLNLVALAGTQTLQFQLVEDGQPKVTQQVPYKNDTGVFKLLYTAKTGTAQAFYKETPDAAYTEITGSPCVAESMKQGPYTLVIMQANMGPGGPASLKLDWIKVTSPADKQ